MTLGLTGNTLISLLDMFCPMHAVLGASGRVLHAGPTLAKLYENGDLIDRTFQDAFELRRPHTDGSMAALRGLAGAKLHLRLCSPRQTEVKGMLVPLPDDGDGPLSGGVVLNLSFGIGLQEAVRDFALTSRDFAATDLAIELLYLIEAKSVAMEASRKLNSRLQGAKIAAEEQAFTDTLTGLRNRRALDAVLTRLTEGERDFALMNVDLDYFKAVNDRLGHAAGDHVLQAVAQAMVAETRSADIVARIGGDEFVVILPDVADHYRVGEIAARLVKRLEHPIALPNGTCRVSASIGAALSRDYRVPSGQRMMEDADRALYAAKERGRGCHVVHMQETSISGPDR
ncbi:diguanylate cyclase [Roseovarius sp. PS-C2]|uniref:GGDEF domain-containing protein n=1 Tax=Roseovarius sp. PS-C2 TaxID=2820814 RepID=UPI0034616723